MLDHREVTAGVLFPPEKGPVLRSFEANIQTVQARPSRHHGLLAPIREQSQKVIIDELSNKGDMRSFYVRGTTPIDITDREILIHNRSYQLFATITHLADSANPNGEFDFNFSYVRANIPQNDSDNHHSLYYPALQISPRNHPHRVVGDLVTQAFAELNTRISNRGKAARHAAHFNIFVGKQV